MQCFWGGELRQVSLKGPLRWQAPKAGQGGGRRVMVGMQGRSSPTAVEWAQAAAERNRPQNTGFLILFIEEKKRREKIDSPHHFFPEWSQSWP